MLLIVFGALIAAGIPLLLAGTAVISAISGRAIVVSGLTVMIALAGLFLTGIDVFSGVAIGPPGRGAQGVRVSC